MSKSAIPAVGRGLTLVLATALASSTAGGGGGGAAAGETVRAAVTRDNWFSGVDAEAVGNNGGSPRLKFKSYQEFSVVDLDPGPLLGRVVLGATLHLRRSDGDALRRVTVGSLAAPWVEGKSESYRPEAGSSSFHSSAHPDRPWSPGGGDLCTVIFGQGGTLWKSAEATPPDAEGWQRVAVDPGVVAARVAGVSQGFVVFDDTGSEWSRDGEKFTHRHMPNRFAWGREAGAARAPYFTVELGATDRTGPAAPGDLRPEPTPEPLPPGEARVSWATPRDAGPAGTVGFFAEVDGKPVPQALIPRAGAPGGRVTMHLHDLGLKPGASLATAVRAVDGAGNLGPAARCVVTPSAFTAAPMPGESPRTPAGLAAKESTPLPRVGGSEVAVVDELDVVRPDTGAVVPPQPAGYAAANHLWDARDRRITVYAARNELVGVQVTVRGTDRGVRLALSFPPGGLTPLPVGRYLPVHTKDGPRHDPIVPAGGPEDRDREPGEGVTTRNYHVGLYVPKDAKPGEHRGELTLTMDGKALALDVRVNVWDWSLPDRLSFLPEMNCYGIPTDQERAFYRLGQFHRSVLNRVPYSQGGQVAEGCAPVWSGGRLDWSAWDRRFGPYFDGSAFADLPRGAVPLERFYLPMHENWPTPLEGHYGGDVYWADRAIDPAFRRDFVEVSRQFADHLGGRGWAGTLFECFLNNKVDFKRRGWSRGSSPWLLDEPASFQDFWALRYFAKAFHEGVRQAAKVGQAKLVFRADVSRPQWQRDALDGLLDDNVVNGDWRRYSRKVLARKAAEGQVVLEYGTPNDVGEANTRAVGWCLDVWSRGLDGVIPWQTVGRGDSWDVADPLALFYPGRRSREPAPSVRLKAFLRGQQDVEYMALLARSTGQPRWALGGRVREALDLNGVRGASATVSVEDAGTVRYDRLRPQDLWALRVRVGRVLSGLRPGPQSPPFEFRTPRRDPSRLPDFELRAPAGAAPE